MLRCPSFTQCESRKYWVMRFFCRRTQMPQFIGDKKEMVCQKDYSNKKQPKIKWAKLKTNRERAPPPLLSILFFCSRNARLQRLNAIAGNKSVNFYFYIGKRNATDCEWWMRANIKYDDIHQRIFNNNNIFVFLRFPKMNLLIHQNWQNGEK